MGSLTKRPTIPKQVPPTRTVYVSAPITGEEQSTSVASNETENKTEVKTKSLLRRARGRLGTILTGFRGLLSEADTSSANQSGRKTLLGE